jgi:hypothetical protein
MSNRGNQLDNFMKNTNGKSERELKLNGHFSSLILLADVIVLLLFLKFPPMRKQELSDR